MTSSLPSRDGFADEYPFESHWLDLNGVRMHFVDEGPRDGEPILCVHGNPTWSFIWRRLIRELSPSRRIIAVDHIGCGFSDKPQDYPYRLDQHVTNLRKLIESLDLRNVTLVGHDWGGCIGMGAATEMPDRFSRFVLMNTGAFRSTQIPLRIAVCRIPVLGPIALRGFNAFSRAALTMAVARNPLSAAAKRGLLAPVRLVGESRRGVELRAGHPATASASELREAGRDRRRTDAVSRPPDVAGVGREGLVLHARLSSRISAAISARRIARHCKCGALRL